MAVPFLSLPLNDREEALARAESASGRPAGILEKDVWVVWVLKALFHSAFAEHLCFKGGTSLSKAYRLIDRFSEDVDITVDIRMLMGKAHGEMEADPVPSSRSQAKRWRSTAEKRLPGWIEEIPLSQVRSCLASDRVSAEVRQEACSLILEYESVAEVPDDYMAPKVVIEFGGRSTGEPINLLPVSCDAAESLSDLVFPEATPRVMAAERTFWEKATAAHVFCLKKSMKGERYARHWYDLVRLDQGGVASVAMADRTLAHRVAEYKDAFFQEKDFEGEIIEHRLAVDGGLRLVPNGESRAALADDYARMESAGLLESAALSFEELMEHCIDLEVRVNSVDGSG